MKSSGFFGFFRGFNINKRGAPIKITTQNTHQKLANDALYYIYRYIEGDINIDELCADLGVSRFHFQRVFKAQMGMNLYESIKSIRMQKAASLLITNRGSTISQIASACGYGSQSAFIRAFKARYVMTPTQWRVGGYAKYAQQNLSASAKTSASSADYTHLEPSIVKQPSIKAYYIRHRGYLPALKQTWQRLQAWVFAHDIQDYKTIGLYHDNPIVTPLADCSYIAAVTVGKGSRAQMEKLGESLPLFTIPAGLYAKFEATGEYGDILHLIQWAYHEWLPSSGYEATTLPSYTVFEKNHFLSDDERFEVVYYLPVRVG